MNILEVSMHAQQIATKHVLCANTLLCTGHVPQFPRILNKESRRSGLRRNPLEEWEMCDREGKTAKGGLSTELSSLGQLQLILQNYLSQGGRGLGMHTPLLTGVVPVVQPVLHKSRVDLGGRESPQAQRCRCWQVEESRILKW